MIYTPLVEKMWDSWIIPYQGKYYMYYLSLSPEQYGKGSWNGISLAISEDLVHWSEYGRVLTKRPEASWMGTGMIQKIGEDFIMNFSEECPAGTQNIYFARSRDLLHWERTGDFCAPDGVNYMNRSTDLSNSIPRWDSLGIVDALDDSGPPYYAFCTASAKKVNQINKNGGLGLLTSNDGLHWTCLPNACPDTDMFPQFEVPEHIEINGRHYVIFCTSSFLSHRFDNRARSMSGGTFYVVSDHLQGPYRLPDGDYMLQGTRDHVNVSTVSVGRPLKQKDQILYYHIWSDMEGGWLGTVKLLEERKPYQLQLRYAPVNDRLKHTLLADTESILPGLSLVKDEGKIPPMTFTFDGGIHFTSLGTSAALEAKALNGQINSSDPTDLKDGRFVTFDLSLGSGEGAGIYFGAKNGAKLCAMLNRKRQRLEFGYLQSGWGPNMVILNEIYQDVSIKEMSKVKILARKRFIEVYIDGLYVSSWRPNEEVDGNHLGFYFEDCDGMLDNLQVWEMG